MKITEILAVQEAGFRSDKRGPAWDAACSTCNLTENISTVCRKGVARHIQEGEKGVSGENKEYHEQEYKYNVDDIPCLHWRNYLPTWLP
jgi:hypothetical protein